MVIVNNKTPFESIMPDLQYHVEGMVNSLRTKAGLSPAEANAPIRWTERTGGSDLREARATVPIPGASPAHHVHVILYPGELELESFAVQVNSTDLDDGDLGSYVQALTEYLPVVWSTALRVAGFTPTTNQEVLDAKR